MGRFTAAAVALAASGILWGCTGEPEPSSMPDQPAATSIRGAAPGLPAPPARSGDERPTQLENCVTAVGADRSGYVAKAR